MKSVQINNEDEKRLIELMSIYEELVDENAATYYEVDLHQIMSRLIDQLCVDTNEIHYADGTCCGNTYTDSHGSK